MPVSQSDIVIDTLPGGAAFLAEPIATVRSLAMTAYLPAGLIHEPEDRQGLAEVLAELICRGAGGRSAREHSDLLECLGVLRSTGTGASHLNLSATLVGDRVDDALPLLLDMIRRPNLEASAFGPSRDLALQALASLEDNPQRRVMIRLTRRHLPTPYNRVAEGLSEHLHAASPGDAEALWRRGFVPRGAIFAFAGDLDPQRLRDRVADHLDGWEGAAPVLPRTEPSRRGYDHQESATQQTHIGVAFDALPEPHPDALLQKLAAAVLSGGMSGRLFTEVREKRGLCYSVVARYNGQRDYGVMKVYAGTTTARAQETLDVVLAELRRLSEGVTQAEFERAKVGMKSRLVMNSESTGARSGNLAFDLYTRGRPRTLAEIARQIESVTLDDLNAFLAGGFLHDFTVSTIGERPLDVGEPVM